MMKFLATVFVASVGAHVLNKYLDRTGALEKGMTIGTAMLNNVLTEFAKAQVAKAQGGGAQ